MAPGMRYHVKTVRGVARFDTLQSARGWCVSAQETRPEFVPEIVYTETGEVVWRGGKQQVCPACRESYFPILGRREQPGKPIKDEFPAATDSEREQLVTGMCSSACFHAYIGEQDG